MADDNSSCPPCCSSLRPAFVGGAELARRSAQKRKYQPPPQQSSNSSYNKKTNKRGRTNQSSITTTSTKPTLQPYPKSMKEYDRFFCSLLSSSAVQIQQSDSCVKSHQLVMHLACSILNIPQLPSSPSYTQQHNKLSGSSSSRRSSHDHDDDARTHHLLQRSSSISTTTSTRSGSFATAREYYMSMAPLVLEESRCIIAESLTNLLSRSSSRSNQQRQRRADGCIFTLELVSMNEKYPTYTKKKQRLNNAPLILNFQIIGDISSISSMKWTRPGNVLLLRRQQQQQQRHHCSSSNNLQTAVLACIVPNGNRQSDSSSSSSSSSSSLSLMIVRRSELNLDDDELVNSSSSSRSSSSTQSFCFVATAVTTLISQVRQMESCLRMVKVSFMHKLLGQRDAIHTRFDNTLDEDKEEEEEEVLVKCNEGDDFIPLDDVDFTATVTSIVDVDDGVTANGWNEDSSRLLTKIPTLNGTQECAANKFLNSPKESIVLVQGPPGTGKTTFLVNVICQRLANDPHARIMVSAPTNKAVTVLTERFLDIINKANVTVPVVLIGVEDKLISSSQMDGTSYDVSLSLQSIFVYTWIKALTDECQSLLLGLNSLHGVTTPTDNTCSTIDTLLNNVIKIASRIMTGVPSHRSLCTCAKSLLEQLRILAAAAKKWECSINNGRVRYVTQLEKTSYMTKELIELLNGIDSPPVQELLATARVIFCTLSTSGASVFKYTRPIDDLLIDEAAAATEPELCIPYHLHPQRLLAVGDPCQLPPTILSRHAIYLGLSRSMHERLMNQCNTEYIMLDHQYRMHEDISAFPNSQFYDGRIANAAACDSSVGERPLPSMDTYSFINVTSEEYQLHGGSYSNEAECLVICELIQQIKKTKGWDSPNMLRIITFYQGQVILLNRILAQKGYGNVLVATVDSSQGCEANLVIISFVRSSTTKKGVRAAAGFLADDRRINVALTRARHQLICVGDANGSLGREGSSTLKNLVSDAKRRCSIIDTIESKQSNRWNCWTRPQSESSQK